MAWGAFEYSGKVRFRDGLIVLKRESVSALFDDGELCLILSHRHAQKMVTEPGTSKATCILDVYSSEDGIRPVKVKDRRVYFACPEGPTYSYVRKWLDSPFLLLAHRTRSSEIIPAIKPKRGDQRIFQGPPICIRNPKIVLALVVLVTDDTILRS